MEIEMWSRAFFLLLLFLLSKETKCSLKQLKLHHFQTTLQHKTNPSSLLPSSPSPSPPPPPSPAAPPPSGAKSARDGRVFYPIGYGADPSGAEDSTDAIMKAIGEATKFQDGFSLLSGINDLGGVVIDFQGSNFRISRPITFPPAIANLVVQGGSLRASNTFPGDRHLIELRPPSSQKISISNASSNIFFDELDQNNGVSYEDITFRDILFDSNYKGGGLLVVNSARIRVDNCFFIHFSTDGILVQGGHETFISSCFLGHHSTVGGDKGERDYTGTAIDLASTDNAVTDVVIFSAAIGIILRGNANMITGVHCYNKAASFGGIGILVKAAQNRIENCYLDYNGIVIHDPAQVHVTNGYFLGGGNVVLKSDNGHISGLNILNNMFSGDAKSMIPIVQLDGEFRSIDQVVIDYNNVNGMTLKSTVGRMTVAGNGTKWTADFSSVLVFPNMINHVQYSFYCKGGLAAGWPAHAVTNVSNSVVVVESEKVVDGVVSISVDQHNMPGEQNFIA